MKSKVYLKSFAHDCSHYLLLLMARKFSDTRLKLNWCIKKRLAKLLFVICIGNIMYH